MKIVFLDIDGVLNSEAFYERRGNVPSYSVYNEIDPEAVALLNELAEDCVFVISSVWRFSRPPHTAEAVLKKNGFKGKVVGRTPAFGDKGCRGTEIREWLNENVSYNHKDYVILDDDRDFLLTQAPHFFQTDYKEGLTREIVDKIKAFFKENRQNMEDL